jgi:hypothetical protein
VPLKSMFSKLCRETPQRNCQIQISRDPIYPARCRYVVGRIDDEVLDGHLYLMLPLKFDLQIAPGFKSQRPILGKLPPEDHWYSQMEYGNKTGAELNPFFYGVTLVHEPEVYTYQADALSANMHLEDSHYSEFNIYRVEWEPPEADGSGGYIKWFNNNKLVYGVFGDTLEKMGTEIPSEPMYLLMNTAVSNNWGFPAPCPEGCACKCFECGNPKCACGMPNGYCDNFPASFEIDYVRVWQAVNCSKHVLGCSTEDRPSSLFIKGHAKRYMDEGQKRPLEPVQTGGASCVANSGCGGHKRASCEEKVCKCRDGYTGPRCLSHAGFDDYSFEQPIPFECTLPQIMYDVVSPNNINSRFLNSLLSELYGCSSWSDSHRWFTVCVIRGCLLPSHWSNTERSSISEAFEQWG